MDIVASLGNLFHWLRNNLVLIALTGCCGVVVILFLYFFYARTGTDIGPEQPIPFSHRLHVGVKEIQCQFCHPYVERSTFPGIPPVEKCLYCHKYIIAGHPQIKKEHNYFNKKEPTPWVKVNFIPEYVFFNHQRHIRKQIDCRVCHGAVETMDRLKDANFQMGFCIECHKVKEANMDCWLACHN